MPWTQTAAQHKENTFLPLQKRNVILYPDLGGFEKWKEKAEMLQKNCNAKIIVSDILEKNATEEDRKNGLDIADFLIRDFQQKQQGNPLPKIEGLVADMAAQNPTLLRLIETFSLVNLNINPLEKRLNNRFVMVLATV